MNSLFQYHKKHTKNSMENMDTDVRVSRVKHLHIQWYNTCTLLENGCLGEVDTFNWLLHNILKDDDDDDDNDDDDDDDDDVDGTYDANFQNGYYMMIK